MLDKNKFTYWFFENGASDKDFDTEVDSLEDTIENAKKYQEGGICVRTTAPVVSKNSGSYREIKSSLTNGQIIGKNMEEIQAITTNELNSFYDELRKEIEND